MRILLLMVLSFAVVLSGCKARVLVLGLDGVENELLDILIENGRVPHLRAIVENGASADLDCVPAHPSNPCFCPPVWMTIFTGQPAKKHGIYNFSDRSDSRRSPTLWDVNHANGGNSTVLSLHNLYPAEPTVKYSVTEPATTYFAGLLYEVQNPVVSGPAIDDYDNVTKPSGLFELLGFDEEEQLGPVWLTVGMDRGAFRMLSKLALLKRGDEWGRRVPELDILLFHSTDRAEHVTWREIQAAPGLPIDEVAVLRLADLWDTLPYPPWPYQFGNSVSQLMEANYWLGELKARSDYDYVILASDHGMEASTDPNGLQGTHGVPGAYEGIFAMSGPGVRAGADLGVISVFDLAPTIAYLLGAPIARDLPGRFLAEAFDASTLTFIPPRYVPSWDERFPY